MAGLAGFEGNGERLAFLYRADRVQPSGLVGEIVLPPSAGHPARQFARTPYAASFTRAGVDFILATVHVLWGAAPQDRLPEITAFAQWMRTWAERPKDWNRNLFVLGDFNLDRLDDPLYQAFVSTGLFPPAELNAAPRTIFDNDNSRHFYDQIVWFSTPDGRSMLEGLTYTPTELLRLRPAHLRRPEPGPAVVARLRPLPPLGRTPDLTEPSERHQEDRQRTTASATTTVQTDVKATIATQTLIHPGFREG